MITLKEIAEKCKVSIATVSNILNNKSNVSEETKKRVLKVVKETGYKPNYIARTLRAYKTNTIGLIVDDLTGFSSPMLINGIMAYCEENNYKTVLENLRLYGKFKSSEDEEFKNSVDVAIQEMLAIKVDGIIYIAAHSHKVDTIPQNLPVPAVIAYAFADYPNIPCIMLDDITSAFDMTNHLISHGNKKIAIIAGKKESVHSRDRIEGYKQALSKANIKFDENLIYYGSWDRESGYSSCKNLLESNKDCDAIFCFNDVMAVGVYDYLREHNIIPGKDISITGFDNREFASFLNPPLTSSEIQLFPMGLQTAHTLIDMINEKPIDELKQYIPCKLVERESVK